MRIAVDCSFLPVAHQHPYWRFPHLLRHLLQQYKGHSWLLAGTPQATKEWVAYGPHIVQLPMPALPATHVGRWLYRQKLARLLRQQQADVWLGVALRPGKLPRGMQGFWYAADAVRGHWVGGKLVPGLSPGFLQKPMPAGQKVLAEYPEQLGARLQLAALQIPFFTTPAELLMDALPDVKATCTSGKPYFLSVHGVQHARQAIELLLAFSVFKKRMRSGMKLVIAGTMQHQTEFEQKLTSYRYRADVVWLPNPDAATIQALLLQAYALVQCYPQAGTFLAGQALAAGVPLVAPRHPLMQQVAGHAACYISNEEPGENLAARLCLLYQNEDYRNQLIENGRQIAATRTLQATAQQLMQYIEQPV
ncbi:MAG: glycosyltransferase [Chitinophagaceae bacterium]|jgi:glycosyltransferase involved in cell wall biosynthesis|nr:glycosyltransferase [Chitinophagaceae bacterium]